MTTTINLQGRWGGRGCPGLKGSDGELLQGQTSSQGGTAEAGAAPPAAGLH